MPMFIADCPRCGERRMTFDIIQAISARNKNGDPLSDQFECFGVCRHCHTSSVFRLYDRVSQRNPMTLHDQVLGEYRLEEVIRAKAASISCPEFVPVDLQTVFDEGGECLAIKCWNAAAAMFRKVVDMVARAALPDEAEQHGRVPRALKPRLDWLFDNGRLPKEIKDLADCIREDGNDAVHEHPLGKEDAEDLADFTVQLLERVYTEPGRLKIAEARRAARRSAREKS